jgi:hypothetical protein
MDRGIEDKCPPCIGVKEFWNITSRWSCPPSAAVNLWCGPWKISVRF